MAGTFYNGKFVYRDEMNTRTGGARSRRNRYAAAAKRGTAKTLKNRRLRENIVDLPF